jgi:uncharacterized protein YdhG (YjbR/CyaY superfamily)
MSATKSKSATGFTDAERAAMRDRAEELKAEGRGGQKKAEAAESCLAKIAEMPESDRVLAERLHAIVTKVAPELDAKTWYGMPAYAKDGKIVCYFKSGEKFGTRYAQFGFEEAANLDDGTVWPTVYAVTDLTAADVKRFEALVKRAVS